MGHPWYDKAHWRKKLKPLVLARDPVCKTCGRYPSTHADHIKPHKGDWTLFCDMANLQGLCASCHSKKTAGEDGGFGNAQRRPKPATCDFGGQRGTVSAVGSKAIHRALEVAVEALLAGL